MVDTIGSRKARIARTNFLPAMLPKNHSSNALLQNKSPITLDYNRMYVKIHILIWITWSLNGRLANDVRFFVHFTAMKRSRAQIS